MRTFVCRAYLSFNVRLMSLCEGLRTLKNLGRDTQAVITTYCNALEVLTQQCRDVISRDTLVAVHELGDKVDHVSTNVENIYCVANGIQQEVRRVLDALKTGKDGFHTVVICPKQVLCRSKCLPFPDRLCGQCYDFH